MAIRARNRFFESEAETEAGPAAVSSHAHALVRAASSISWVCLGLAAMSAIAAAAIYIPMQQNRSAAAPEPMLPTRAPDFAEKWQDNTSQLAGRFVSVVRTTAYDQRWLWTDTNASPYATRFTWGDPRGSAFAAVPMPMPRPDIPRQPPVANAAPEVSAPRLASLPPDPDAATKSDAAKPGIIDRLFGDPDKAAKAVLAANPNTVLYDIVAKAVYMPDGEKLEAHSGFGEFIDDPDSMHRKNVGVTPPNVYSVKFREKPFHGVRALRMTPVGGGNMYKRDGILAHSFLLGDAGASNGCISVKDYDKFLKAFEDGKFNQIIVLRSAEDPVPHLVADARL